MYSMRLGNDYYPGSQVALVVKNLPVNAGDIRDSGSIPGSGRSPGGAHGNPLQYSCLETPHGQRSLVRYSPWGLKASAMAEVTLHTCTQDDYVSYNRYYKKGVISTEG